MKKPTNDQLQSAFLILVLGLGLPPLVGFGMGYWVTRDTAQRTADNAVLDARTTICVAQFAAAPDYERRLKEYKALDYSAKTDMLAKGGWSRMPGENKASDAVTTACGNKLDSA